MNCVVFKLDERLHEKLIKFYKAYEIKTPPYAKFAAKNYDVTITLYEKGKVMFQGIGADIEASIWQSMQSKLTGKPVENTVKSKDNKKMKKMIFMYTIPLLEVMKQAVEISLDQLLLWQLMYPQIKLKN